MVFHPLGEGSIASIAQISCSVCTKRLEERGYEIRLSPTRRWLVEGVTFTIGLARPLKRAIQQQIEATGAANPCLLNFGFWQSDSLEANDDQHCGGAVVTNLNKQRADGLVLFTRRKANVSNVV
ncbi:hypothetical protein KCP75_13965 [Salmonella enterica subsp. enterica]|nr:hypothetical protein KCP75_13965 [Salmonella enterica subsp. enterica]